MALTGKIRSLFLDKEKTQAIFPLTSTKAVSDDNGVSLDAILDNVNENIKKAAPRNLLDNSDFTNPVNQRGFVSGSVVANGYFIDRWKTNQPNITVTMDTNGIAYTGEFAQILKDKNLIGKTFTLAVGFANKTVLSVIGTAVANSGWYVVNSKAQNGLTISITCDGVDLIAANIASNGTAVQWAALYEGEYTLETLPEYQPKGYAAELAECQRYFIRLIVPTGNGHSAVAGSGTAISSGTTVLAFCPLPVTMRALPTVSGTSVELLNKAFGTFNSISNLSIYNNRAMNGVLINVIASSTLTAGDVYYLVGRNTTSSLQLSAEL